MIRFDSIREYIVTEQGAHPVEFTNRRAAVAYARQRARSHRGCSICMVDPSGRTESFELRSPFGSGRTATTCRWID